MNTPLWLDEVLSIWVIRMGSAGEIWSAIKHGSEFVPPTFNLLLHYYSQVAGTSYLALRVPSIVGACTITACSFLIFRRYLGLASAAFGSCLILEGLRFYALQVRPYCVCMTCFGIALLLWDDLNWSKPKWRYFAIFLCLAGAASFHFYGVLFVPCLGVVELLRFYRTRQFRLPMWIALFLAGASTLVWLPLIHILSAFNAGDTSSYNFYAKPSLAKLLHNYADLFFEHRVISLIILTAAGVIAVLKFMGVSSVDEDRPVNQGDFWAMVIGVALLPLIVWVFALFVTRTYNERYTIAGVIGLSGLITGAFGRSPQFKRGMPVILLGAAVMTLSHPLFAWGTFDHGPVFEQLQGDRPIVIADVQQFFTLEETAPASIRSRLVYLMLPADLKLADPTVVNQLKRNWAIDPKLPIQDVNSFLSLHKDFYLLDTHAGTDDTPLNYISARQPVVLKRQFEDGTLLFESK